MFRQESEPMKFALEYCPNFSTGLHVPGIQNEGKNIPRKNPVVSYTFENTFYCEAHQVFPSVKFMMCVMMEVAS